MSQPNDETLRLQLQMEVDKMKGNAPIVAQYIMEAAKQGFTHYTALVYAGFTEAQALEIVKAHGISPKIN